MYYCCLAQSIDITNILKIFTTVLDFQIATPMHYICHWIAYAAFHKLISGDMPTVHCLTDSIRGTVYRWALDELQHLASKSVIGTFS